VWAGQDADALAWAFKPAGYASFRFRGESPLKATSGMLLSVRGRFTRPTGFQPYAGLIDSDQWSSKGVAYGRAEVKGVEVFVVQTHTQASYVGKEAECRAARDRQLQATLMQILEANKTFRGPLFLLGDLNIVGESDEYYWFAEQMRMYGLEDAWVSQPGSGPGYTYCPGDNPLVKRFDDRETTPQRLDYIFFRPDRSELKSMTVPLDWKTADGLDLSDHYPVQASFGV